MSTLLAEFEPGTSVALLRSRPGRDRVTAEDRRWNQVLAGTARTLGLVLEPTFLANDRAVLAL